MAKGSMCLREITISKGYSYSMLLRRIKSTEINIQIIEEEELD